MKFSIAIAAFLMIWPMSSGKVYQMSANASVPAATGTVRVQKDKSNRNTMLDIKVNHLARPSSLTPSASKYLVWIRPNGGDALKQGAIGVNKNLAGELKVETVSKDIDVFITAEQGDNVTVPSSVVVLHTHISTN
uniref:Anti-sigma-K factor rskA n=1 Tax=mine drainage metagenome TaxID=410659 RepID=E6QNB6_9ZZZZ